MLELAASDVADWLALPMPVLELTVMMPAKVFGLIVTVPVVRLRVPLELGCPPPFAVIEILDTVACSVSSDTVALTLPTVMAWLSVLLWLSVLELVVVLLPVLLTESEVETVLLWLSVLVVVSVLLWLSVLVLVAVLLPELEIEVELFESTVLVLVSVVFVVLL